MPLNAKRCRSSERSKARRELRNFSGMTSICGLWKLDTRSVKFRKICWNQNSKLRHGKKYIYIEVTTLSSFRSINHHLSSLIFSPQLRNRFHTLALLCSILQSLVYPIRVSARTRGPLCTTSFVLCHQRIALQRDTIQNLDPCECDPDCFLWNPPS